MRIFAALIAGLVANYVAAEVINMNPDVIGGFVFGRNTTGGVEMRLYLDPTEQAVSVRDWDGVARFIWLKGFASALAGGMVFAWIAGPGSLPIAVLSAAPVWIETVSLAEQVPSYEGTAYFVVGFSVLGAILGASFIGRWQRGQFP